VNENACQIIKINEIKKINGQKSEIENPNSEIKKIPA